MRPNSDLTHPQIRQKSPKRGAPRRAGFVLGGRLALPCRQRHCGVVICYARVPFQGIVDAGEDRHGRRLRALVVVLWRAGLRIQEALALTESDLDERRGSVLVRHGKNDKRREVGTDSWAWPALAPWIVDRADLPVGPLFCVIDGATRGRAWSASAVRVELRRVAGDAGVRRRFAPHQLRHAHALLPVSPTRKSVLAVRDCS